MTVHSFMNANNNCDFIHTIDAEVQDGRGYCGDKPPGSEPITAEDCSYGMGK